MIPKLFVEKGNRSETWEMRRQIEYAKMEESYDPKRGETIRNFLGPIRLLRNKRI